MSSRLKFTAVSAVVMLDYRKQFIAMFVACATMACALPALAIEVTLDGSTTLFKEGFEGGTIGELPGPTAVVGSWDIVTVGENSALEVVGAGGPGPGAAAVGDKYLSYFRATEPPSSDVIANGMFTSTVSTGAIHAEWWTYIPELDTMDFGVIIGMTNSEGFDTFSRMAALTVGTGTNRLLYRRQVGETQQWDLADITYSYDTWQLWKIDWTLGSGQIDVTIGDASQTLNIPDVPDSPGLDRFMVRGSNFPQSYFLDGNSLEVPPPAQPGDFDSDGDVDGADFVAWQTHFPTASGATLADGDADGDGDVDGADFVVWQTNFPFTPSASVSPVPEPATCLLASLALIGWQWHKFGFRGRRFILFASALGLLIAFAAPSQAQNAQKADTTTNEAKLPNVLLIGDSISGGYAADVGKLLRNKAKVVHEGDVGYTTPYTTPALEKLDELLALADWDVIHFNFGLNDFEGSRVSIEQYERNLREIVRKLKCEKCELIWCNTTPIVPGKLSSNRAYRDVPRYNEVARKVMEENKIEINDLYSFALPRLKEIQIKEDVHFKPDGYAVLAKEVASAIERLLRK